MNPIVIALDYLKKNEVLYAPLIEPLRRGHGEVVYSCSEGVIVYEKNSQTYMIAYDSEEIFNWELTLIDSGDMFVCFDDYARNAIQKKFFLPEVLKCVGAVYEKKEKIPIENPQDIRLLDKSYEDFINRNYHLSTSEEYIRFRLEEKAMYGLFIKGEIAGFIGMHDEGSIGLLEILPKYRRRGLAYSLEVFMINKCLDEGVVPFCQIVYDNEASLSLQRKLGFTITKENIYWIF